MPRQEILSPAQHGQLLMLPTDPRQITDCYTFTHADLDLIAKRRGEPNRLGFAVQLGFLRYPGRAWVPGEFVAGPPLRQSVSARIVWPTTQFATRPVVNTWPN